jgi:hypothetical protein
MRYAQFYSPATGFGDTPKGWPIEACGDRAVIILDGRQIVATSADIARHECKRRGFIGFTIHAGDSFTRSNEIRNYEAIQ